MIEIYLLEQLTSFARNGTLSRAAAELHISQPAMSRSMKKLEDMFGLSLFDRDNRKITLNETGRVAAKYAERVLEANREMIEMTAAYERSQRAIVLGSCSPFPSRELMPILQDCFREMAITAVIVDDDKLISGLKNRIYQLAVLHRVPDDPAVFYQRFVDEQLCITVPEEHPFAGRETISFQELSGISILANGDSGFWLDICQQNMNKANLLVQNDLATMREVVDASSIPAFNSNRMIERGYITPGRISIPIIDEAAHVTFYLSCLNSEKRKYNSVFNAVRSTIIRGHSYP